MLRCIVLIFRGTSTASLTMLIIGLSRNAPIAILIAWQCIRSSCIRVQWLAELYSMVYLSSYYCSASQQQGVHICTPVLCCNSLQDVETLVAFRYMFVHMRFARYSGNESKAQQLHCRYLFQFSSVAAQMNVGVVSTFAECYHYRLRAQEHESSIQ